MNYLNLKQLRRCCRPDATEMDDKETEVVYEILLQYLILDLNVYKVSTSLYKGGYISEETFKSLKRVMDKESDPDELKTNKKVIKYLTNKVSFIGLLWALSSSGYQRFANLLLSALEKARYSSVNISVQKTPIVCSKAMHMLVKQLKFISDSKIFDNPIVFIRRLAIRFKEKFRQETEERGKTKLAEKYFAILAVELDNFTFMENKYVSRKSLEKELRRVVPFTSNPALNEALLNGRIAEISALNGDMPAAVSTLQDVVVVILTTETCPESANLFYMQLNVMLQNFGMNPSDDMKQHYIEIGFNGLRMLRVLDGDIMSYWNVCFMLRIIFCILDLGISGRPLHCMTNSETLKTAQYLLSEVKIVVQDYGIRRIMCYNLAMGRMLHIQGNTSEAVLHLKEAKQLAIRGGFVELQNIEEYEKSLVL